MTQGTVLVASPRAIGNTPLAAGSRVPPWPALTAPRLRRTAATAALDVIPSGLSRTSQPWTGRPRALRAIVPAVVVGCEIALDLGPVEQLVDAACMVERGVERESEARRKAQRHFA